MTVKLGTRTMTACTRRRLFANTSPKVKNSKYPNTRDYEG